MRREFSYCYDLIPPGLIVPALVSTLDGRRSEPTEAKVDTGADVSVLPADLRDKLRIPRRGVALVKGAFDTVPQTRPTFFIRLVINGSFSFEVEALSVPRRYFLIGRDVLNQLVLHADGPSELFELIDGRTC